MSVSLNAILATASAVSLLAFPLQLNAHHGLDFYDTSELVEIDGKVIDFELSTPHSFLYVETIDTEGNIKKWEIEGGAASGIAKAGLTKTFLATKPSVKIKAFQSKDKYCYPTCKAAGRDFEFEKP